ncbi:hypothetical protein SAMN05443575_0982 [Jatrophihabitans endophyticus]|uniref:Uncharacterized protein n=1 Tax=Jatrophihabitans endophyticus TaxID=1206085 RepID=A0A1M5ES52_9ACTN|nr:hypothetical protein [Jatrophihabitans endophyticus]SHF81976.1 hypothetical protein SAMN05443575_0982 [Jatrophihabitans endophyticus]
MNRTLRKVALSGVAALAVTGGVFAAAAPAIASDAPPGSFEIDYDANGSSLIKKPNSTITLGPTVSKTYISDSGDGTFTADLPLPPTKSTFKILGFVPVSATVNFVQVGRLQGQISQEPPIRLSATAKYYIRLTNVKAAGLPTFQGNSCQTVAPVSIPVATPNGQVFDLTEGGTLAGTYTIGKFANCGLTTALINSVVPGPNNTVAFQLSNGRFVE